MQSRNYRPDHDDERDPWTDVQLFAFRADRARLTCRTNRWCSLVCVCVCVWFNIPIVSDRTALPRWWPVPKINFYYHIVGSIIQYFIRSCTLIPRCALMAMNVSRVAPFTFVWLRCRLGYRHAMRVCKCVCVCLDFRRAHASINRSPTMQTVSGDNVGHRFKDM